MTFRQVFPEISENYKMRQPMVRVQSLVLEVERYNS